MAYELIKVSELPELTTPSDPNVIPIQDGDYLKRISFENLKETVTGDVADDLAAEVTARESAVSDEATARGNADTAILADLASPYSASSTYAVGDYCTKDEQLYRCTTAITTAEAWTAAHWSAVALGDDTRDLRNALNTYQADTNDKIGAISDVVGLEYTPVVSFTDGRGVKYQDGATQNSAIRSYTNYIPVEGMSSITITMLMFTRTTNFGIAFYSANDGTGFISGVREKYNASEAGYEERTFNIPENAKYVRSTWCASNDERFAAFSCVLAKSGTFTAEQVDEQIKERTDVLTENVLDPIALTLDKFINMSGTMGSSSSYAVTDFIPVSEGDRVICTYADGSISITMRYVTAYNAAKTAITDSGAENVGNIYTVPSGIKYIRISGNKERLSSYSARISLNGTRIPFQTYYSGETSGLAKQTHTQIELYNHYPLSALPAYFQNILAYKPLGELSKGYVCFVSDDGDAELATYTIPMFNSKDVPGTWAVMRSSTVWNSQAGIDAVIDSVENHGCCLAQHGGTSWLQYDEMTLNRFFDLEQDYWDTLGVSVYGAVCPAHDINDMIRCVAGGRFLCLRTGYDDANPRYYNYCNGPRSNLYGLCSQSVLDGNVSTQSATLDLCKENHWLKILHFHENEMDASGKAQLEAVIDYAKQIGLTFITMKDIPWII